MSKNQLTMAVIGGVAGLVTLVMLALVYMGAEDVQQARDDVDSNTAVCNSKRGITRKPGERAMADTKALAEIASQAYLSLTNRGAVSEFPDRDALQKMMYASAVKFRGLPADAKTKIVSEDFGFGPFAEYIKGTVPASKDVPKLYRRWGDVAGMVEILLSSRATELQSVKVLTKEEVAEDAKGKNMRNRRQSSAKKAVAEKYPCSEELYEIEFLARPAALVDVLNALAADKARFYTVDSLKFEQVGDPLIQAVGDASEKEKGGKGAKKPKKTAKAKDEEKDDEVVRAKTRITDPSMVEPFKVTMKFSTVVFASKEESK